MRLARRVAEHFVAPAGGREAREGGTSADGRRRTGGATPAADAATPGSAATVPALTAASIGLLAAVGDAPALAAGLGLALAQRERAPAAVICLWSSPAGRPLWRAPALPAAARLACALRARGHVACGSGRLVIVRLVTPCEEAAGEALRVLAAAGSAPSVLALAGPRAAAFDRLLDERDLVVVAVAPGSDPALARLALADLERGVACAVPPAHPSRSLAAAGVALLPSARRALAAPVAALS
jgi:hypothetical protein